MATSTLPVAQTTAQKWPRSSPFYNPMTMRSSVLEELNDHLIYSEKDDYHISCVYLKGNSVNADIDLQLRTPESRAEFTARYAVSDPDACVFFVSHVFSHRVSQDRRVGDMRFTLSLDKDTWLWLLEAMKIHPKFVESLYFLLGSFCTFVTYANDKMTPESFHVLVKAPPAGHLEAAFYLRYDFQTRKSMAIVAGTDLNGHAQSLLEHFSELKGEHHPFGLIYTVVYRYFYFLEWQRRRLDHSVIMMEHVTGRGAVVYSNGSPEDPNPEQFDLSNMHWIGGNQRNVIFAMDFQVKLVGFLQKAHHQFVSLRMRGPISFGGMEVEDKSIQEALEAHRITVAGVFDNCRVIGERAQWQLNAADSLINTWIAKQSQRTADESKNIAVETRRDSTSMKTIASLTMVYLPSTFVATIFGMDFFNVSNGIGPLVVSPEIWKFIVTATILTVLTILVWIYLNKKGVPYFLKWIRSVSLNSNQNDDDAISKMPMRAAPILIDLPQQPGDKANRTPHNSDQNSSHAGRASQNPNAAV